jgi:hypothetical protein
MIKKIAVPLLVTFLILILTASLQAQMETTETMGTMEAYELKSGAEEPDKVYAKYARAVHSDDLNTIRSLVYSKSLVLWSQNAKQMLAMTKNNVPINPVLSSKRSEKQYQYNYMIMTYTGQSPKGTTLAGEVRMIVENGVWKVYQENWRAVGR